MSKKLHSLFLGLSLMVVSGPILAEDPSQPPGMEEWVAATTPGEQHAYLATFEGLWDYKSTMLMDPSQPVNAGGECEKTMIMGGRYLQEIMQGEMMEQPFNGLSFTAYDNHQGKFLGTWIDNFGTGIIISHGEMDEDGKGHVLYADYANPMTQETEKLRMTTRVLDKDHHRFEYYVTPPGKSETRQMMIDYTRRKEND